MGTISIHFASRDESIFWEGRDLAKRVYHATWGTPREKMSDDYQGAVLVTHDDEVIGNLNIKHKKAQTNLPSEVFFSPDHWKHQCDVPADLVAELCSFAIASSVDASTRQKAFRALMAGAHLYALNHNIQLFVTIQKANLINTIIRILRYPFFESTQQIRNPDRQPRDQYWIEEPPPRLYYAFIEQQSAHKVSLLMIAKLIAGGVRINGFELARDTAPSAPPKEVCA